MTLSKIRLVVILAAVFFAMGSSPVFSYCTSGIGDPPFLGASVTPNLLLMIDNSASMYDLAHVDSNSTSSCYDDTYSRYTSYAGYFKNNACYRYNLTSNQFEESSCWTALIDCLSSTYKNPYTLCMSVDSSGSVTSLYATGNFLNWATASKFDIEKKILTGGKYESSKLIMESRGCLGRRFIKKIPVWEGGTQKYLTLGIRPPEADEKSSSSDDTTRIEIFPVTQTGFNNSSCQLAIDELGKETPNLGMLKGYTEDCMNYTQQDKLLADVMNAFNHSLQECWYFSKQGDWQSGSGTVTSMENDCEAIYEDGVDPTTIVPENRGYVCYGVNNYNKPDVEKEGYVGRCWEEWGESKCIKVKGTAACQAEPTPPDPNISADCCVEWADAGWESYDCVEQAIKDYCDYVEIPEVTDPSDLAGYTGELWNIPAVLIDSAVLAQLNEPVAVLKGEIATATPPQGLIQKYASDIRMGTMLFNFEGSASECNATDSNINYKCTDTNNKDGSKIGAYINQGSTHTTTIVDSINAIKATSWTPIAEAMYNAIGYFTQNSSLRLNPSDFNIGSGYDPIEYWCQANNILLISEGGSTADLNAAVKGFCAAGNDDIDTDDVTTGCDQLDGSTLLDDLTYYAKHGNIYASQLNGYDKRNITTYIVASGTGRTGLTGECSPTTLITDAATNSGTSVYLPNNPEELEQNLTAVFEVVSQRASSGTAVSVLSGSRTGAGSVYQALFWPEREVNYGGTKYVTNWTGEVQSLFVTAYGEMYEDTDGDRSLNTANDNKIKIFYDDEKSRSRACYLDDNDTCTTVIELEQIKYVWQASTWLNDITDADITTNRASDSYISSTQKRYIFTWNDLDNDGIVDQSTEIFDFQANPATNYWENITVASNRAPVNVDFGSQDSGGVNATIDWVRGLDQTGMRSRRFPVDSDKNGSPDKLVTWRLADVVNSTPMVVAAPAENYDLLYNDTTYAQFARKYKNRRNVIYFGSNGGMVHAVNGGFYNPEQKKFCLTPSCTGEDSAPKLGAELWAYVPYNLTPHLKCLTDMNFVHKYYVDLRPRIFDVRIFREDDTYVKGWGTILVVGMRFGGAEVKPGEFDLDDNGIADYPSDNRRLRSSYMIFDITNPEVKPTLLGEITYTTTGSDTDLAYTTVIPTVVPMFHSHANEALQDDESVWYLIFGSGPTDLKGQSVQKAKVAVLPLKRLTASSLKPVRIPDSLPTENNSGGRFELSDNASFVSDMVTVDFDLTENYKADAVYFGTVSGSFASSWTGKMYRLVTRSMSGRTQDMTTPSEWVSLTNPNPNVLLNTEEPVTAAPNVGWDGTNFWVYWGTGRFFHTDDRDDNSTYSFYGVKEPQDCNGTFTWATVPKIGTYSYNAGPGHQGLLRTDQILVHASDGVLSCKGGGTACLPTIDGETVDTFHSLLSYMLGYDCAHTGVDGWYREFSKTGERNLGQASLLGGLLTYLTYQPFLDVCMPEGLSFLYGIYYQTGTAWYKPVFLAPHDIDAGGNVKEEVGLGRGLALTPNLHMGKEEGASAFIQTSTGAIILIPEPNLPLLNVQSGRIMWHEKP